MNRMQERQRQIEENYFKTSSKIVFIGGVLCALCLYIAIRSRIENLHNWLLLTFLLYSCAFAFLKYAKSIFKLSITTRVNIQWLLLMACASSWSYVTFWNLDNLSLELVAFISMFVCGLSSSTSLLYLPALRVTVSLILCITVPFTVGILNSRFEFSSYLAALTTVYTIALIYSAAIIKSIYERFLLENSNNSLLLEEVRSKTIDVIANAKSSMLIDMASGMAHEINNPLTTVSLHTDIMEHNLDKEGIQSQALRRSLSTIKNNVNRITEITKHLSYFFQSNADEYLKNESLNSIINDLVAYFNNLTNGDISQLIVSNFDNSINIYCNKTEFVQALKHIIKNATEAFQDKNPNINYIRIDCEEDKEKITIRISDNGKGIQNTIVDKIFHPFFTTKEVGKGLGLGLSIANSIIRNHKGHISLDVALNLEVKETRFVIQIPKQRGFDATIAV